MTNLHRAPDACRMWYASLSTMWAMTREEPFANFFTTARTLGFSHQELNHQVTTEMMATVDPKSLRVDSVHEPCPCAIPRLLRKERGIDMSSPDESLRSQAVGLVRGSLHLAHRLGATAVVVHPGEVPVDKDYEQRMRVLYTERQEHSSEYADLKERFIEERMKAAPLHLEALRRSLLELVEDAEAMEIRLGLENRDHYNEIPLPDELDELLALRPGTIEYWHDTGHAEKLAQLGFHSQREWLERFSDRMIGIHLHDNDGWTDHLVPGLGTIDWKLVSSFVPSDAIRTFEVRGFTTQEQMRDAQWMLHKAGCLEPYDGDE